MSNFRRRVEVRQKAVKKWEIAAAGPVGGWPQKEETTDCVCCRLHQGQSGGRGGGRGRGEEEAGWEKEAGRWFIWFIYCVISPYSPLTLLYLSWAMAFNEKDWSYQLLIYLQPVAE